MNKIEIIKVKTTVKTILFLLNVIKKTSLVRHSVFRIKSINEIIQRLNDFNRVI